jgi:hypothetical protein
LLPGCTVALQLTGALAESSYVTVERLPTASYPNPCWRAALQK